MHVGWQGDNDIHIQLAQGVQNIQEAAFGAKEVVAYHMGANEYRRDASLSLFRSFIPFGLNRCRRLVDDKFTIFNNGRWPFRCLSQGTDNCAQGVEISSTEFDRWFKHRAFSPLIPGVYKDKAFRIFVVPVFLGHNALQPAVKPCGR